MVNHQTRENLPKDLQHTTIIMDGNGCWAEKHFLPRLGGLQADTENLHEILKACVEFGVKYLIVYAFSTENWKRSPEEVSGLLKILAESLGKELGKLHKQGGQLRHIGRYDKLNPELSKKIRKTMELTKNNQRLVLNIAWNYGGRDEIVYAVEQIIKEGIKGNEANEEIISQHLFTANLPDPDLVIRTSGEMCTANFLPWQTAYVEWYFTPILWSDFKKLDLEKGIQAYNKCERRFGGRIPF